VPQLGSASSWQKLAADDGYELPIAANESEIKSAAEEIQQEFGSPPPPSGTKHDGIGTLLGAVGERPVDLLFANAGRGLGNVLDQDLEEAQAVIDLKVTSAVWPIHAVASRMRTRNVGRILITGSIADFRFVPSDLQRR
jgi:NAD(P)-dependent dehydrogenase (short-subunit alcohol dehydrogenase family)